MGFAIYGLASGPLAHKADVVLIESYPETPERIYSRATIIDYLGALLAPLLASLTFFLGLDWRWLMISLGFFSLVYAVLILRTRLPSATNSDEPAEIGWKKSLRLGLREVLKNRNALNWLCWNRRCTSPQFGYTSKWE